MLSLVRYPPMQKMDFGNSFLLRELIQPFKSKNRLTWLMLIVLILQDINAYSRYPDIRITGEKGKDIELRWNINVTLYHGIYVDEANEWLQDNSRKLYLNDHNIPPNTPLFKLRPREYVKERFGNRIERALLNQSDSSNPYFSIVLRDVGYDDTGLTINLNLGYSFLDELGNKHLDSYDQTIILESVAGGPELTSDQVPRTLTFSEFEKPSININFSGNPKPIVRWGFDKNSLKYETSSTKTLGNHSYTYEIQLPLQVADMCGKQLFLEAIRPNDNSHRISQNTTIDIISSPEALSNVKVFLSTSKSCLQVQWQRVDAGNCGVEYLVEYMSGPKVMGKSNIISKEFVCEEKYVKATSVRIWRFIYLKKGASRTIELGFRNENSDYIEKSYDILQERPAQIPLKEKDLHYEKQMPMKYPIIIIVITTLFLLLLLVAIGYLIRIRKRMKYLESKRNSSTNQSPDKVGSEKDKDQKVPGNVYTNIHIKDKDLAGTMYMTWDSNGNEPPALSTPPPEYTENEMDMDVVHIDVIESNRESIKKSPEGIREDHLNISNENVYGNL